MSVTGSRRIVFALALVVGLAVVAEAASAVALGIAADSWFSPGDLQERRRQLLGGGANGGDPAFVPIPGWVQSAAVHPYVGYVEDPWTSPWDITDFGFYEEERPLYRRGPDRLIVGIFGGSFAYGFREHATDALVAALRRDPRYTDRDIVVTSTALGGYKQPQQLMALNWLLALGGEFDVVINIDGFNEVALHDAENRRRGVFPAYPRSWYYHALGIGDGELVELAADSRRLRRTIAEVAAAHSQSPWRWSFLANLVWTARDGSLRRRLAAADERLAAYRSEGAHYAASGPAFDHDDDEATYATLVDVWRNGSLQMARLARANDIAYVHALQPNQYLEGSKPLSDEERRSAYRPDQPYRAGVVAAYPRLRSAGLELATQGVAFVDLTQAYAEVPDTVYVDDCCHVNPSGYVELAEPVAAAVVAALDARD